MCELLGVRHPIIQAGMGPFSNNHLCIAVANAGALGLISSSGIASFNKEMVPEIYRRWVETAGANPDDNLEMEEILCKALDQTNEQTKESGGVFGINIMVSNMALEDSEKLVNTAIEYRAQHPEVKDRFKVIITSAGDPMPSVKGAHFCFVRCQKAGVDMVVASGHEGGFHASWEPVHSMVLLPAVVEALTESGTPVVGTGGFCDGKSLAAAIALGAVGIQMGTRFLATQESDFAALWKQGIVEAGDRGTLIARGMVGPARWIKTDTSKEHQKNTLALTPELFLDTPGPITKGAQKLMDYENKAFRALNRGDRQKAMYAGGECAQRINDLPKVKDLVDGIISDAEKTIEKLPAVLDK